MTLRVLQVAYPHAPVGPDAVGGAEVIVSRLDAGLTARGLRSTVVACEGSTICGRTWRVPLEEGPLDDDGRARAWARHRRAVEASLAEEDVDVVHVHGVDFWRYLPAVRVPCLATLHLPLDHYPAEWLRAPRPGLSYVCVSHDQRRRGEGLLHAASVIENGVPMATPDPMPRGGFVLCLGRICPEKGFHLALDAARAAGVALVLAGRVFPFPEHERYFEREIRPRLDAGRRFIGPVAGAAKARLLASAACIVIPSLIDETSSLVAMEALAAGTPVVARPAGALVDIVEDGVTGYLANGVEGLAAAIGRAPRLSSARCRAAARARFDVERMAGEYVALYRSLAASVGLERSA